MTVELYQEIALTRDFPEYGIRAGDVATLVDRVSHPDGGKEGCVLEVFNAVGGSIVAIAIPISAVKILHTNEILTVHSSSKTV